MQKSNFCVFILSNGRADSVKTVDVLKEGNYTGDWYIVCDDLDADLNKYLEKYGEKVIVFDKKEYAAKMDTMNNKQILNTVLYARQATFDIARKMGYRYFAQFDDDIKNINIRYEENGKLKGKKVKSFNVLFELMVRFMEAGDVSVSGFSNEGGFFGGIGGKFSKGLTRFVAGAYIFDASKRIRFKGVLNEDYNLSAEYGKKGHIIIELTSIAYSTSQRGTNDGGLKELYSQNNDFTRAFYSVVASPDCAKIKMTSKGISLKTNWNNHHAMIISDRYKRKYKDE